MKNKTKSWASTNRKHLYLHSSGIYYARLVVNGKQTWRSLRTKLKGIAEKELEAMLTLEEKRAELGGFCETWKEMGQVLKVREAQVTNDPALKESTKRYWKDIHRSIVRTWPGFEGRLISKISREDCEKWAAKYSQDLSATRYNNALSALKILFSMAIERGIRLSNPAEKIKRCKPCQKDLVGRLPDSQTFQNWVMEIRRSPNRWREGCGDLVEFLAYTGLRLGEVKWVKWKHVDDNRGEVLVTGNPQGGTKNREIRRVPIIPDLAELLSRIRKRQGETKPDVAVLEVTSARKAMNRAALILDIPPLTHHDLRHFFATTCIESGVDIPTVSKWLGHKDGGALAMKVYGHLRNEHSLAAAQKVSFR